MALIELLYAAFVIFGLVLVFYTAWAFGIIGKGAKK